MRVCQRQVRTFRNLAQAKSFVDTGGGKEAIAFAMLISHERVVGPVDQQQNGSWNECLDVALALLKRVSVAGCTFDIRQGESLTGVRQSGCVPLLRVKISSIPLNMKNRTFQLIAGGTSILAVASSVYGQQKPFSQPGTGQPPAPPPPAKAATAADPATTEAVTAPEPNAVENFFHTRLPEAITQGKFSLNARLRFEYVDQDGLATVTEPSYELSPEIETTDCHRNSEGG